MPYVKEQRRKERPLGAPTGSQTLVRGLRLVEAVAEGVTDLRALAERIDTSVSTTHRLVSALAHYGYLLHIPRKGYALGPRLMELGFRAQEHLHLPSLARPYLEDLSLQTQDTVHLGVLEGGDVVYIDKVPGKRHIQMASRIGGRFPALNTGLGKMLLVGQPEAMWDTFLLSSTACRSDSTNVLSIKASLREIARQGYAYDLEENEGSIRCVAAPICDARDQTIAAISISSVRIFMTTERMASLVPIVQETANAISQLLGWHQGRRTTL